MQLLCNIVSNVKSTKFGFLVQIKALFGLNNKNLLSETYRDRQTDRQRDKEMYDQ